ncbi:hypothetical protein JCM19379_10530 [Methyloparacoccus murrellii]|jgi:hypothetical protein
MMGILLRFLMALVLVFATWNPSGHSYLHWLLRSLPDITAPLAFTGVVLLIGWVLFLHATLESLGFLGVLLAAAFFGTLTWLFFDQGWITAENGIVTYVSLVVLAAILAVGMAWSHLWRRLSGQVEVDEDRDQR